MIFSYTLILMFHRISSEIAQRGIPYYYNFTTGITQWQKPDEVSKQEMAVEKANQKDTPSASPQRTTAGGAADDFTCSSDRNLPDGPALGADLRDFIFSCNTGIQDLVHLCESGLLPAQLPLRLLWLPFQSRSAALPLLWNSSNYLCLR